MIDAHSSGALLVAVSIIAKESSCKGDSQEGLRRLSSLLRVYHILVPTKTLVFREQEAEGVQKSATSYSAQSACR